MSIADILQENSEKHMHKNMVGDTIVQGVMVGIVAENNNEEYPGMVRVQIPTRDKNKNVLQWMKVINLLSGKNWGSYIVPEVGEQVVVAFENGNINNAYVIGSIYKSNSEIPNNNYTRDNNKKLFLTKGGNQVFFDDEADKQKISICTKNKQTIVLDDEKKLISINDKDNKNIVKIDTENGVIELGAEKELKICVNDVKAAIDGESGKISIDCNELNIDAKNSVTIKTANYKLDSTNFGLGASATGKIEVNGPLQYKASVIKMG